MPPSSRLSFVVAFVATLAGLAFLINREWYMIIMMKRLSGITDPMKGVHNLEKLVKVLPKSASPKYVILAIQPKMGTTWVGHITHQLLAHGKDIDANTNLMEDSPYPELGFDLFGVHLHELNDPVYWKREPFGSYPEGPVTIRTHVPYAELKTIGATERDNFRLVAVFRDPADVIMSSWRFLPTVAGIDHKLISQTSLMRLLNLMGALDKMFIDYADFWERRHDPNVLVLFFEDLKQDLRSDVHRLSKFLDLKPRLTSHELDTVVNQSTHKFMASPEVSDRFNDMPKTFKEASWKQMGITENDLHVQFRDVGVVRKDGGKSGDGTKQLPRNVIETMSALWAKHVMPRTGCKDVEEMRVKIKQERTESVAW
eukprot:TRINITY_DN5975_c0_g1_i1.p1 TRINITY_DN5975_c0_g1~~TRINITY_DN5975_c0_g1_i1.p1  ORF type:complete len:370 (+),score=49.41 TRINITY_DN5975_c0_g1_i1:60-1169(+)